MAISQRQAVFNVTLAVLASRGVEFVPGTTVIHDVFTKEMREETVAQICSMFVAGEVEFKATESNAAKLADPKELRKYVGGLITNHHNKDKALNGGCKYEAKNPGSRAGSQDEQVKELRKYRDVLEAQGDKEDQIAKVDEAIEARLAQVAKDKAVKKVKEVDLSVLPEEIRALIA